jgi:hypothetical protein
MTDVLDPKWRQAGDPAADALVAALADAPGWQRVLQGNARNGAGATIPVLADFFATAERLPPGTRPDVLARATRWCDAHLSYLSIGMLGGSLPLLFLGAEGAQVLTETGAMVDRVDTRINRTGRFVLDVTEVGGMGPGGRALRAAAEVRLIHALVRARASGPATAICQQDMVTTLFAFAIMPIRCARRMGVAITEREAEDHYALWYALAPALGVRTDLLPTTFAEATHLLDTLVELNVAPSEHGRQLAAALLDGIARHLAVPGRNDAAAWLVRFLLGERLSNVLSIPALDAKARSRWARLASTDAARRVVPMLGRDLHRLIVGYKLMV